MNIGFKIDVDELVVRLQLKEKQVAYAAVIATNKTAERIQLGEIEHADHVFMIRKRRFMLGSPERPGGMVAKLWPRASIDKGRAFAEIFVGGTLDTDKGGPLLLRTFEHGGERKPSWPGAKSTAVPLTGRPARPTFSAGIPYEYSMAGLHFAAFMFGKRLKRQTRSRKNLDVGIIGEYGAVKIPAGNQTVQWKGRQRTFILTHTQKEPYGGVFQRIGPARGDIREIYAFRRNVQLDDRLKFIETAQRIAAEWFAEEMERQLVLSVQHNAGKP